MQKIKFSFIIIILCQVFAGCSNNSVTDANKETLILQLDGVIENLGGDCSGVQVRTRTLGTFALADANKIKFNFSGMSDADLSSISIYYLENDVPVYFVNLQNRDQINNTTSVEVQSPGGQKEILARVTLKSSVCTGQIFYLTFSDLKIFTIK